MNSSPQKNKDRDLSIMDFFDNLQEEYYINELRSRIYPSPIDKKYYKKVMGFKKEKIEDIAHKNSINCIFSSEELAEKFRKRVYPQGNILNFRGIIQQDIDFYYMEEADVRVKIDENNEIGKIKDRNLEKNIIYVKLRGAQETKPYVIGCITRIF